MKQQITKILADRDALNLTSDLSINLIQEPSPLSPPNGYSFSIVSMERDAPHSGEMHPDGDEIVYVISGKVTVALELDVEEVEEVNAGNGIVIPKGVWHKIHVIEPAQLVTVSPGPNFEFR